MSSGPDGGDGGKHLRCRASQRCAEADREAPVAYLELDRIPWTRCTDQRGDRGIANCGRIDDPGRGIGRQRHDGRLQFGHGNHRVASAERTCLQYGKRSEEHTSELQSRQYLVCRLLLEKKKKMKHSSMFHM